MKEFLYIGQNTKGTTSNIRNEYLKQILIDWRHSVIDTNEVFLNQSKLFKSFAFRFNRGPAVEVVNKHIKMSMPDRYFDLIWVDKGVYIKPGTLEILKKSTSKLVHYTPDTAFIYHKSHLFNKGIGLYDFLITTKSYELNEYYKYVENSKVILTTQGFDPKIHRPYTNFSQKQGVIIIGLFEPERGKVVKLLVDNDISVTIAGKGWIGFINQLKNRNKINYLGTGLFAESYGQAISSSLFGLGLLSKKFPELHTTRTFEIPACATALLTEDNDEIKHFFSEDQVLFFRNYDELIDKIKYYSNDKLRLQEITENGYHQVCNGGFDYKSLLSKVVNEIYA